ncbi:MAG: hypothetical protein M1817_004816 [Caeruleum heppii]|nr:MAG: hypothetical protein M1817_004816 [Caeruleum heppii]
MTTPNPTATPLADFSSPAATSTPPTASTPVPPSSSDNVRSRGNSSAGASPTQSRLRSASLRFAESAPPSGMWAATGEVVAKAPSIAEIRRGSLGSGSGGGSGGRSREGSIASGGILTRRSSGGVASPVGETRRQSRSGSLSQSLKRVGTGMSVGGNKTETVAEEEAPPSRPTTSQQPPTTDLPRTQSPTALSPTDPPSDAADPDSSNRYSNGYIPPPKLPWQQTTAVALRAFLKFTFTPLGFLIVLYGLNVVAWGGMLFLLLCNAAPAMCRPTCNDINSPRRIWIEIDSQILNALFCVTGFGLIPWRFRDLYYLLKWRVWGKTDGLRRLAGIHSGWYRLPEVTPSSPSSTSQSSVSDSTLLPLPLSKTPPPPPTGHRAPPTAPWKLSFVIGMYVLNTFLQAVLSGFMWGLNRYDRPPWSTGLFVALACGVAGAGGWMVWKEGKRVKGVEGVVWGGMDGKVGKGDVEGGVRKEKEEKKEIKGGDGVGKVYG